MENTIYFVIITQCQINYKKCRKTAISLQNRKENSFFQTPIEKLRLTSLCFLCLRVEEESLLCMGNCRKVENNEICRGGGGAYIWDGKKRVSYYVRTKMN